MGEALVVATGGTISMKNGDVAPSSLGAIANDFVEFANKPSPFFDSNFAYKLANFINNQSSKYRSIVVTHGTDTMEESAFYMDLVLSQPITLVFTGAIHMQNHSAYDGEANLRDAILAAQSLACGVYIAFGGDILPARYATKVSALSARAFGAPKCGAVARVVEGRVVSYLDLPPRKMVLKPAAKGKVALIRSHYDIDSDLVEPLFLRSDGVVVEGFGGGRVARSMVDLVKQYASKKPVVVTSSSVESSVGDGYLYEGGYAWAKSNNIPLIYSQADGKKSAIALNLLLQNRLDPMQFFDSEVL